MEWIFERGSHFRFTGDFILFFALQICWAVAIFFFYLFVDKENVVQLFIVCVCVWAIIFLFVAKTMI